MEEIGEVVVLATSIVYLATWPNKEASTDLGEDQIVALVDHFATVSEDADTYPSKISDEWTALISGMYSQLGWFQYLQNINCTPKCVHADQLGSQLTCIHSGM